MSKGFFKFNINHYVYVKILDKGYEYLANKHVAFYSQSGIKNLFPEMGKADYYKNKADENGYTKMQAHDFINKFGEVTSLGFFGYYETTIMFEEKDLTKIK